MCCIGTSEEFIRGFLEKTGPSPTQAKRGLEWATPTVTRGDVPILRFGEKDETRRKCVDMMCAAEARKE
jgi:hypothetical protein